jgi:hypothetical protein
MWVLVVILFLLDLAFPLVTGGTPREFWFNALFMALTIPTIALLVWLIDEVRR